MGEFEIYEQNELKANRSLAFISAVVAGLLFVFWVLCLCGVNVFSFTPSTVNYVLFSLPVDIVFLLTPLIFINTKYFKKPGFKYFLIVLFTCAVAAMNMILPKDFILLWAACLAVGALYFDPKVTMFSFILTASLMLIVTPLGAIYGSWESNVMNATEIEFETYINPDTNLNFNVDSRMDRIYWLTHYNEVTGSDGINRWIAMFVFYFLPRFLALIVIAQLANGLSKRTKNIQMEQVNEAKSIQRMSSELTIASTIQSSVLPSEFPDSSRCELFASMDPAKQIGGDLYDFFKIDADHSALVIGDVSGKGIPASLFMMKTQSLIKALTLNIKNNPAKILTEVNKALCEGNEMNMFVTCWLGILDLNDGTLNYTSAGHNPPLLKKNGTYNYLNSKNGLVLGAYDMANYVTESIKLEKGDKLLLYTDGVTEAHNEQEELYGEYRLLKLLQEEDLAPAEMIFKIKSSIKEFAGEKEQFDDITMLMIEYHKPQSIFAKKFAAKKDNLEKVQDFIFKSIKSNKLTEKDKNGLRIVIEEIFINIASYSFENYGFVDVGVNFKDDTVTIIFADNGKPFNPLERNDPNVKAKAEDRGVGGLGIFMVKQMMDKVYYDYKDKRNILTLVKKY